MARGDGLVGIEPGQSSRLNLRAGLQIQLQSVLIKQSAGRQLRLHPLYLNVGMAQLCRAQLKFCGIQTQLPGLRVELGVELCLAFDMQRAAAGKLQPEAKRVLGERLLLGADLQLQGAWVGPFGQILQQLPVEGIELQLRVQLAGLPATVSTEQLDHGLSLQRTDARYRPGGGQVGLQIEVAIGVQQPLQVERPRCELQQPVGAQCQAARRLVQRRKRTQPLFQPLPQPGGIAPRG